MRPLTRSVQSVLTVGLSLHFTNPVCKGELCARGQVVPETGRLFVAESELRDGQGQLLAKGSVPLPAVRLRSA